MGYLKKPFDLYEKQKMREVNASVVEANGLDFDEHSSWQINMDNDSEPINFYGKKDTHGFIKVTNNAAGQEMMLNTIADAKSIGANTLDAGSTISLSMTNNDEFFVISVFFYDNNKPALTISKLAGN